MKLSERITQLAKYDIRYETSGLPNSEETQRMSIVARFDDGEGIEFVDESERYKRFEFRRMKGDPGYQLMLDEFGEEGMQEGMAELAGGYDSVPAEMHMILDMKTGRQYAFKLPSRELMNGHRR